MGGFNRAFLFNNAGSIPDYDEASMDEASVGTTNVRPPSEVVYIVIHDVEQQCPFDSRYSNYYYPSRLGNCRKNTEIISVHRGYYDAASSASKHVRVAWEMDEEDEEWLEQLDWQGEINAV